MKTNTYYGLSIYMFLTAIHGISGREMPVAKKTLQQQAKKCNLSDVIKTSDYFEKCKAYNPIDTGALPPVDVENVVQYLCTGIFETANRICELKINYPPMNPTVLKNQIEKLQPVANNLTDFCLTMTHVISNLTYSSAITSITNPTIIQLNKFLVEGCKDVCWKTIPKTAASSLCSVLLWENEIIANSTTTTPAKPLVTKPQSTIIEAAIKPADNHLPQQSHLVQQVAGEATVPKHEPELDAAKISGDDENSHQLKLTTKTPAAHIINNQSTPKKDDHPHSQPHANIPDKAEQNGNVETGAVDPAKKPQDSEVRNEQIAAENSQLLKTGERSDTQVEDSPQNERVEEPVRKGENAGADLKPDGENDDNGGKIDEDGDDEDIVPDHADFPPITDNKKIDVEQSNQIPASSNHDKEDDFDGQKEAATNQESTAPRDHRLINSEPLDPPQHFFAYFMAVSFICLLCYVGYHKKHKIMAIIFEGRKSRGGRGRRRPNTAGYRKLDCNLEEAVTSQCNSNVTHVIY